jgi:hypothetical protein
MLTNQIVKVQRSIVKTAKVKGSGCSASGTAYERQIAAVCRSAKSPHNELPLCSQTDAELAGSGAGIDIKLNWRSVGDIGVEAKRPTPDWMQMKLIKSADGSYVGVAGGKIPEASRLIFNAVLASLTLFGGKTPPFLLGDITYSDWTKLKAASTDFKDVYIPCGSDTIAALYKAKGCQYIQVAGKGLYHTGIDVCDFGVPAFVCDQQLRVRIKVHTRSTARGFASLSITAAAQPVSLSLLTASPYSLDSTGKLPLSLVTSSVYEQQEQSQA